MCVDARPATVRKARVIFQPNAGLFVLITWSARKSFREIDTLFVVKKGGRCVSELQEPVIISRKRIMWTSTEQIMAAVFIFLIVFELSCLGTRFIYEVSITIFVTIFVFYFCLPQNKPTLESKDLFGYYPSRQ